MLWQKDGDQVIPFGNGREGMASLKRAEGVRGVLVWQEKEALALGVEG
jgi:hypothetical protein